MNEISRGPESELFNRFQKNWLHINPFSIISGVSDILVQKLITFSETSEVINWIKEFKRINNS